MIPSVNSSGVLPPFLPGNEPADPAAMAPYRASIKELASEFATTPERAAIFTGLLDFRDKMRNAGIDQGFQWIDGSFLEDCEKIRGRPPKDIDLVTFARRPPNYQQAAEWKAFVTSNLDLFSRVAVKAAYKCDAFYVDLFLPPEAVVACSRYWFGLFSHQRSTYLWKGMIEVPLIDDDADARALLRGRQNAP